MSVVFPEVDDLASIPTGDMPGDSVQVTHTHLEKARTVFPAMWQLLEPVLDGTPHRRAVVSVHGGSGVGKSEVGSLLAHGLNANGIGAYVLSGDNYPRRVPSVNDAERLRVFRDGGARALAAEGLYDATVHAELVGLRAADQDADPSQVAAHPWMSVYLEGGRLSLSKYLGTPHEIAFDEISAILEAFHGGAKTLMLKRMGRTADQLWYEEVDLEGIQVIVLEWTHGNSEHLHGVDLPILLNSTPEETLAHRRSRNRDGGVDSPFTTLVLGLEQEKLHARAHQAALIVSKSGEIQ
ncbi:MAG: ATP-binding protein, partial [Demequinaceae bacterium]|nr:ATP-binding protein [Demequinaceae bacterium]